MHIFYMPIHNINYTKMLIEKKYCVENKTIPNDSNLDSGYKYRHAGNRMKIFNYAVIDNFFPLTFSVAVPFCFEMRLRNNGHCFCILSIAIVPAKKFISVLYFTEGV